MKRIWNNHKINTPLKPKVFVGMSGGVDSTVAAALLKKAGYSPVGIFMKFWSEEGAERKNKCCTLESERRALLAAHKIGIPFYVLNLEREFKETVVDFFLKELKAGRTPNPCVVCNKEIKFNFLFNKFSLEENGLISTGHYARMEKGKLLKAKDEKKDQSYFLWKLNREILDRLIFPIGDLEKKKVREIAKKLNLPAAQIKDSQEVCFISSTFGDFLKRNIGIKKGKIIDTQGNILGEHEGLWFYTIGQRRGINLSGGPYFVLRKDVENNALIVTKEEKDLFSKEAEFDGWNWISKSEPKFPVKIKAKIRSMHKPASAVLENKSRLMFRKPQAAITPGQSIVFYKGEELLGGGVINYSTPQLFDPPCRG